MNKTLLQAAFLSFAVISFASADCKDEFEFKSTTACESMQQCLKVCNELSKATSSRPDKVSFCNLKCANFRQVCCPEARMRR